MPRKSTRLTAADRLAVARLTNECHELGDDAGAWQHHLIGGLLRLTGGAMAAVGPTPPAGRVDPVADWVAQQLGGGWPSAAVKERWERMMCDPAVAAQHPAAAHFFARPEPTLTLVRREMVEDHTWDRSPFVNDRLRADGMDEGLISRTPAPAVGGGYLMTVVRAAGQPPFTPRDGRLTDAVTAALTPHLGRGLWLTTQPSRHGLTPRQRQVLDCLLDGDSEKQAGLRLGLAAGTVHVHVKRLYRQFGVGSRAELLAHFLRRYRRPT